MQVLPDFSYLPGCQKNQCAAFIEDPGVLVVWSHTAHSLIQRARDIEKGIMQVQWDKPPLYEKDAVVKVSEVEAEPDLEQSAAGDNRPLRMHMPFASAFTLFFTFAALGGGWREIAFQSAVDRNYHRFAFIVLLPFQVWLALFFFQALVGDVLQCVGPVSQMRENSRYYSGLPPKRLRRDAGPLPHVTVQMPVYKEGLDAVIAPTIESLKTAISTYEMQGGTANIFINDDGMDLISPEDAQARKDFYEDHNIGWVARPKQVEKPDKNGRTFLRRGKSKKASNMNYAMWVSVRVEEMLAKVNRTEDWTQDQEADEYDKALSWIIEEEGGYMQADGDIRIGDYILIIDSDTRVPADCFLDFVSELHQCLRVAILQLSSGVMNVTDSFFENGITFFTNMIYTQIRYSVASGDVAPFVGHNAVLRWSALQTVAFDCQVDKREKYWSEETVSEDFDMALRLQAAKYIVRLGAYFGDGFKEGVSLTVYDELSRWEKYAHGCSELLLHPLKFWPTRGPFTKLFRTFLCSNISFPSKITIMAYVGTYYALGCSWFLTLANYFLTGWLNGFLDHYYLDSFRVYIAIIVVFYACGNFALALLRYRTHEKGFLPAIIENIKWIPLFTIFLGGVSMHICQAILSHLFSVNMSWGSTSKEAEDTNFFREIPKILKNFRGTLNFCMLVAGMMAVLARFAPLLWRIDTFIAIFPEAVVISCHFLMPIALNPGLMNFTF